MHDNDMFDADLRRFLDRRANDTVGMPTVSAIVSGLSTRPTRPSRLVDRRLVWVVIVAGALAALWAAALLAGTGSQPPNRSIAALPTNGWIAYSTRSFGATSGVVGEIYLVKGDGSALHRVVGGDDRDALCPTFSHEGTRLAYLSGRAAGQAVRPTLQSAELVVLAVDSAGVVAETQRTAVEATPDACLAWAPSDDRLAVMSRRQLAVVAIGGATRTIPLEHLADVAPSEEAGDEWSPSAADIDWDRRGAALLLAMPNGVWLVPVDGTPPTQLSTIPAMTVASSPDGARLAFGPNQTRPMIIVVGKGDRAGQILLGVGFEPRWSPAGDAIAFRSLEDGLVVVDPDGSRPRVVSRVGAYGFGGWSPDGTLLLQMIDVSGVDWALRSVSQSGGDAGTLISGPVGTGSTRNFPGLEDVSWQPVYP